MLPEEGFIRLSDENKSEKVDVILQVVGMAKKVNEEEQVHYRRGKNQVSTIGGQPSSFEYTEGPRVLGQRHNSFKPTVPRP